MLTRVARSGLRGPARSFFWSSKSSAAKSLERPKDDQPTDILSQVNREHAASRELMRRIEEAAVVEYKQIPALAHWNRDSPEYVPAERDQEELQRSNEGFNYHIDNLKRSLKLQEELYLKIEALDRPYLRGTPGLNTNVFPEGVKDYSKPAAHSFQAPEDQGAEMLREMANKHRFVNDVVFNLKIATDSSNMRQWQQEVDSRPVNPHFHKDKGFKWDVTTPYEQRYPHVADRLGYPEFLGDDVDRLFKLENEMIHPNYLDQPFVQTPPINADSSLNFGEGEVIYENPNVVEWSKLTQLGAAGYLGFYLLWRPYHKLYATTIPAASTFDDFPIAFFEMNAYNFDNYGVGFIAIPMFIYSVMQVVMVVSAHPASRGFAGRPLPEQTAVQRGQGAGLHHLPELLRPREGRGRRAGAPGDHRALREHRHQVHDGQRRRRLLHPQRPQQERNLLRQQASHPLEPRAP